MRLLSITVRNYRIHRELTVELDPARTVVGGPNESGKSTLVEAVHRGLFLKAKGNTAVHRAMRPHGDVGHPEVEIRFESGGKNYKISKRFGPSGTATLTCESGGSWADKESEEKLRELLGIGDEKSGTKSAVPWGHLWVWQGEAGGDPSKFATEQRDPLLARLKVDGGAAAMESGLDAKVAARLVEMNGENFTGGGKVKAGSELGRLEAELGTEGEERDKAKESFARLERAMADVTASERTIADQKEEGERLAAAREETVRKLKEVAGLREKEGRELPILEQAVKDHGALAKADGDILELGKEIGAAEGSLGPKDAETAKLEAEVERRKKVHLEAAESSKKLDEALRAARNKLGLAAAWRERFECELRHARVQKIAAEVEALNGAVRGLESELAKLPNIDANVVKALRADAAALAEARAGLEAMAAGVTVVSAGQSVKVGGAEVAEGETRVIDDEAELEIGDVARIRISPGGGTSLAEARKRVADGGRKLETALDRAGVKSVEEAEGIFQRREMTGGQVKERRAELAGKEAETIGRQLAEAANALEAAEAEVGRRNTMAVAVFPNPENREAALDREREAGEELNRLEAEELAARAKREAEEKMFLGASEDLADHSRSLESAKSALNNLRVRRETLEESYGDGAARKTKLAELAEVKEEAEKRLLETREALKRLQPEALEADLERQERAMERARENREEATKLLAVAKSVLENDGNEDPAERLAMAEARVESVGLRHSNVQRKAKAIRLLTEMFAEERRALAHQFTGPLSEKISGYLQQLFGPDARAEVELTEDGFEKLVLGREGRTFEFDSLSGGTREQTAAAFRLAMAEILADDFGGCLPVVFDDAFVNSDPERIQTLQRMLDLAARRGLQVILLTCDPGDYAGLGAKLVGMRELGSSG